MEAVVVSCSRTLLMVLAGLVAIGGSSASAGTIIIDDFQTPAPSEAFFSFDSATLPFMPKGMTLIEQESASILGGQRDLLLEVAGNPSIFSTSGIVGTDDDAGLLRVATDGGPGTVVTLQYDGIDAGDNEVTGLSDHLGLGGFDLTDGQTNDRLQFDFLGIDSGSSLLHTIRLEISAVGESATATFVVDIDDSTGPTSLEVPFSDFSDDTVFQNLKSLTFTINGSGESAMGIDIHLDRIAAVPEPATLAMLLSLVTCWAGWALRRRR